MSSDAIGALPILCIHNPKSVRRHESILKQFKQVPSLQHNLRFVDAIMASELDFASLPITPLARKCILASSKQKTTEPVQFSNLHTDNVGVVGTMMSHAKCWDRILSSNVPFAIVMEDDATLAKDFEKTLRRVVEPLMKQHADQWDVLRIGGIWDDKPDNAEVTRMGGKRLIWRGHLCNLGYIVSHKGAQILRENAFPVEMVSEAYMGTLRDVGLLRMFLLPKPIMIPLAAHEGGIEQEVQHARKLLPQRRGCW